MERFQTGRFHAVNFVGFPHRGVLGAEKTKNSLKEMVRRTHANWVNGFGIWDWPADLEYLSPYAVSGRPAEAVIAEAFGNRFA